MSITRRRITLVGALALVACVAGRSVASGARTGTGERNLPARLDDKTYWKLVTDFSEPGGYFRSDNFVSNEVTFQYVIPQLLRTTQLGGVYLGVGPDQNFSYIVAMRPKIAFIFDIRRQNMLEHLMYKAVIERSTDRADFLARLFSRPRQFNLGAQSSAEDLFTAYDRVTPDSATYRQNLADIESWLTKHHGFTLSADDMRGIAYVYGAFFAAGPELTYSFAPPGSTAGYGGFGRRMPTYGALMVETDSAGEHRSYLGTEANFQLLKSMEANNLIVPLVGDFAGEKAIRAVGNFLREHDATVTAFYTSNVEQYLFRQNDDWRKFFTNVSTLPLDSSSTFIRAVFNFGGYVGQAGGPRSMTLLAPIGESVRAFNDGHLLSYYDAVQMSH